MLVAAGAFLVGFVVVYVLGHLLAALIIALASVAAGGYLAWLTFRFVAAHGGWGGTLDHLRR